MKKTILLLMISAMLPGVSGYAEKEILISEDGLFEYTSDGKLVRYFGDSIVYIPAEIDGTLITEIAEEAFFDLGIESVYIEEGIEKIGKSAFEGSNIIWADIPGSVVSIGDNAFLNCRNLEEMFLRTDTSDIGFDALGGTGHIKFYVYCTFDEEAVRHNIGSAKGDGEWEYEIIHEELVESMTEKDIFGNNMLYCQDCGFKGSMYISDVELPFEDVSPDAWYYSYISTAYDFGILNGKSDTVFDPDAGLTCAEAAKIAASIHANQIGNTINPQGEVWYESYVEYCYNNLIMEDYVVFDWDKQASRAQVAYLLSRCDTEPHNINNVPITDIPDVYDTTPFAYEILDLYNKGVAVGSNNYYFYPDANIKRSEVAALVSRMICWDMRIELPKG